LAVVVFNLAKTNRRYKQKYSGIIDVDEAVEKAYLEKAGIEDQIKRVKSDYAEKRKMYDSLLHQVAIYDESIQLAELGFYKPHYDFDTSEKFKNRIDAVRSRQKELLKNDEAVFCRTEWVVEG